MAPAFVQIANILAVVVVVVVIIIVVVVVVNDILATDGRQTPLDCLLFGRFAHGIVQIRLEQDGILLDSRS